MNDTCFDADTVAPGVVLVSRPPEPGFLGGFNTDGGVLIRGREAGGVKTLAPENTPLFVWSSSPSRVGVSEALASGL